MNAIPAMKQMILVSTLLFLLILTACEQEIPTPGYVGTWVSEQNDPESNTKLRTLLDFSEKSFTNLGQVMDSATQHWIDFIGVKGRINIDDNIMNVSITEMGISGFDIISGTPTGKIYYYRYDQTEFSRMLKSSDMNKTYQSEFSLEGNQLILRTDKNNDGDFDEDNEIVVFRRM